MTCIVLKATLSPPPPKKKKKKKKEKKEKYIYIYIANAYECNDKNCFKKLQDPDNDPDLFIKIDW